MHRCHGCGRPGEVPQHCEVAPGVYRKIHWCDECAAAVIRRYVERRVANESILMVRCL
jgi:hypothetical protein